MAHALSGMTEQVNKQFLREREELNNLLYTKTANDATRELCKGFHHQSKWGFQVFVPYKDFCQHEEYRGHDFLHSIGRFVGSRSHNQFKPGLMAYNARESLSGFLTFWEGRKTDKAPNQMFTSNKKALNCPRTLFEFEIISIVYSRFIQPMLLVISGHLGNVKTNLDLRPVVAALLHSMDAPS